MRIPLFVAVAAMLCAGCNPQPIQNDAASDELFILTPSQAQIQLDYAEETVRAYKDRTDTNSRKITRSACEQRALMHQGLADMLGKDAPPKKRELDAACTPLEA